MSEQSAGYRVRRLPGMASLPAQPRPRGGSKPYRRGAEAERSLLHQFWQDGCIAIRSAGSAGPFDLAIVLPNGGRLLQVKLTGTTPTPGQIVRWLDSLPDPPSGWTAELWIRTPHGWASYRKASAKEQAS